MENASKALLMAGGILIGVLILALMVTLFVSSREISTSYDQIKHAEAIQQFNVNFTQYLGQDLTIQQVVTISNFAIENGIKEENITGFKTKDDIKTDMELASNKLGEWPEYYNIEIIYKLNILEYSRNRICFKN